MTRPATFLITVSFKNAPTRTWGPYTRANTDRYLAKIKTTQRNVSSVDVKKVTVA